VKSGEPFRAMAIRLPSSLGPFIFEIMLWRKRSWPSLARGSPVPNLPSYPLSASSSMKVTVRQLGNGVE
jgi:hypothetical protein